MRWPTRSAATVRPTGPGGACRPVPSPDGKSVAYVRRVRGISTLFVMDLASGKARAVYAPLERDNQETWAVHGVYPALAWTPAQFAMLALQSVAEEAGLREQYGRSYQD